MSLELDRVVFIGRTFAEYVAMFDLDIAKLQGRRILDCPAGACSFTKEAADLGIDATASDMAYQFSPATIRQKGLSDLGHTIDKIKQAKKDYIWTNVADVPALAAQRKRALLLATEDMARRPERYVAAVLPELPFANHTFDLVLAAHFLFTYSEQLDGAFHQSTLDELLRVAKEVRVFPLVSLDGKRSVHVDPLFKRLRQKGYTVVEKQVSYQFQKGADSVAIIRRQ
ncbi:MAG: S-adenosylmethionine (SAM)-dependent methyltransferase [Shouchella clausii]